MSELSLGGIIKHLAAVERQWQRFIVNGPEAMGGWRQLGRSRPDTGIPGRIPDAAGGDPGRPLADYEAVARPRSS